MSLQLVRTDLAAMYTAWSRLDAGVGAVLREVVAAGAAESTLTFFFSDNGIPFPAGKTNLLEQGQHEPLLISSPNQATRGRRSSQVASALDLLPSMLQWAGVTYPASATAGGQPAVLTGSSLLPMLDADVDGWRGTAFGSHQFHSLYAYYPSRSVVDDRHLLILNLAYNLKFPILEDVAETPTWRAIESAGEAGNATGWVYDYLQYRHRPEWQLFDLVADPLCLHNLAGHGAGHGATLRKMQGQLRAWQVATHDPWAQCDSGTSGLSRTRSDAHSDVCSV